jgi:chemotaxis protein histidine kinase CheA
MKREDKASPTPVAKKRAALANDEETRDPPDDLARKIIYTASMHISVFKVDTAMRKAEQLTVTAGGYVQSMSGGSMVVRVPAPRLRELMSAFSSFGVVEARTLSTRDVSEEFVDLRTRIRVLHETQTQLIALLKRARNVEEALKVRQALDRVTMELEQATGRMRMLQNLIGFSTLTISLVERGPHIDTPSSNDPFTWVNNLGVEATEWK